MKNTSEINDLMLELLEENSDLEAGTFTARGREIINEIADYAENTEVYKNNKMEGEVTFADDTAHSVFMHMLTKFIMAPLDLLATCTILCCMPFVRQKLNEEDAKDEKI